jgi:hypothetical protein
MGQNGGEIVDPDSPPDFEVVGLGRKRARR